MTTSTEPAHDDHQHRPPHATRRLSPPARRRRGELHPRIGRAGPPRPELMDGRRFPDRRVRRGSRARTAGRRVPRLRPCRSPRADGALARRRPGLSREPARRLRDARALRPRRRGRGGTRRRSPTRSPDGWKPASRGAASRAAERGRSAAHRIGPATWRWSRTSSGTSSPGTSSSASLPASGAIDVGVAPRHLPRPPARQPLPVPLPARARRDRPRRLLARAARRVRERSCEPLPHRRHDRADRGRCRAPALVGEGSRRARDARRPRSERPLSRVQGGDGSRCARHGGRTILPRLPPRLGGRRGDP